MKTPVFNQTRGWRRVTLVLTVSMAFVLILGAGTWGAGTIARSNLLKQYPAPGQLVDMGGYRMHLHCLGEGSPTVIMEAGLDDFSIFWSLVQPAVARFTRACAYDRAGLGWSDPSPYPRTSETMVKELHTLLAKAGIDKPYVLVGHSFGGALMQLYAYTYSDQVEGIALVDATHDELFQRLPTWRQAIAQKLALYHVLAPLSSFGLLALAPENIPNRGLPANAFAQYRALAAATRYFETGISENEAFEQNLAEVRAAHRNGFGNTPLIVLSRSNWEPLPGLSPTENQDAWQGWQEMQSALCAFSSHSKQTVVAQSGHNIQLEQPQVVIDAIREIVQAARQ